MKIREEQIVRLADQLLKSYRAKDLIVLKREESLIRDKIKNIVTKNFQEEEIIEEEARKMLASYANQVKEAKEMDHYKMFVLIKQKLAEKRGFIL